LEFGYWSFFGIWSLGFGASPGWFMERETAVFDLRRSHICLWTWIFFIALWLGAFQRSSGQDAVPSEYQVKAACIYNFTKFVEWPPEAFPDPSSPFVIGVIGDDPFNGELHRAVQNKDVCGRRFVVRHLRNADEARSCQILFVSRSERKSMGDILAAVSSLPILTVSETERFVQSGGIINFLIEQNKVRFEINAAAAKKASLKVSSKLLNLGRRYERSP
jgi:YfiR/HmsC-like